MVPTVAAMKAANPQFKIRLPDALKGRLELAADAAQRSVNAEIVTRLEASFERPVEVEQLRRRRKEERALIDGLVALQTELSDPKKAARHDAARNEMQLGTTMLAVVQRDIAGLTDQLVERLSGPEA